MPFERNWAFLKNYVECDIELALLSSHPNDENRELALDGHSRPLNLRVPPLSLREPIRRIDGYLPGRWTRYVALWSRAQILEVLQREGLAE